MAAPFQWSLVALETLMAEDQMDRHAAVLRAFSVVELWRLRRVCRAFHRWGTAALAAMPRVAVVGGVHWELHATQGVEVLDMSTLRWSSGVVPALPEARHAYVTCSLGDGRVVVVGGWEEGQRGAPHALQWVPGAAGWAPLPELAEERGGTVAVTLLDGRAMVLGGSRGIGVDLRALASVVEVLAADGSGWSALTPMGTGREGPAAAVLPCGKVLVAGGGNIDDAGRPSMLRTAELWDPATGAWSDLPPMARERQAAACCVLPSGRVAVVDRLGGEAFDPLARTWQPLAATLHERSRHGLVAVQGGMLAVGGGGYLLPPELFGGAVLPDELFDEASGRWFELPHPMAQSRRDCSVVSLSAAAVLAPAAAAASGP